MHLFIVLALSWPILDCSFNTHSLSFLLLSLIILSAGFAKETSAPCGKPPPTDRRRAAPVYTALTPVFECACTQQRQCTLRSTSRIKFSGANTLLYTIEHWITEPLNIGPPTEPLNKMIQGILRTELHVYIAISHPQHDIGVHCAVLSTIVI